MHRFDVGVGYADAPEDATLATAIGFYGTAIAPAGTAVVNWSGAPGQGGRRPEGQPGDGGDKAPQDPGGRASAGRAAGGRGRVMSGPSHTARGFTLLELLVAIAIFAVVSALALTGYTQLQQQSEYAEQRLSRLREVQRAVQIALSGSGAARAATDSRAARRRARARRSRPRDTLEYRLQLTRAGWSNTAGLPRPTLQRVGYRLDQDRAVARSLAGARPNAHRRARESADAGRRAQHQLPLPHVESRLGRSLARAAGAARATSAAGRPRSRS